MKQKIYSLILPLCLLSITGIAESSGNLRNEVAKASYIRPTLQQVNERRLRLESFLEMVLESLSTPVRLEAEEVFDLGVLKDALHEASAPSQRFSQVYKRLCTQADHPIDTKKAEWSSLREQVLTHSRVVRAFENERGAQEMSDHLLAISRCLNRHPSSCEQDLRAAYQWLFEHFQSPSLLRAFEEELTRPNEKLFIRGRLLEKLLQKEVKEAIRVDKVVNGARIEGTAHMTGRVSATLTRNTEQGEIALHFTGNGFARDVRARVGKATVWSDATSRVHGRQSVFIEPRRLEFKEGARSVVAQQTTTPHSSSYRTRSGVLKGRVRAGIALRIAGRKVPDSDVEGARETEAQLHAQMRTQVQKAASTVNKIIEEKFTAPLDRQDLFPRLKVSSSEHFLTVFGTFAPPGYLSAGLEGPPVSKDDEADIYVKLHESAFNNLSRVAEGMEIEEAEFRKMFFEKLGFQVPIEEDLQGESLASFQFQEEAPFMVSLRDGLIGVSIRIQSFYSDGTSHVDSPHVLKATYKAQSRGDLKGIELIRQGEIIVEALGEQNGTVELTSIAPRFLPRRALTSGIRLDGKMKNMGTLAASEVIVTRGWISVAWRHFLKSEESK